MEHFKSLVTNISHYFVTKQEKGISLISWATSIRWFGWGFVEYLIPIFLFSFAASYTDSGILKSSYNIAFLLALPLVGIIANHIRGKYLIIAGLLLYPFISIGYFMAGATGVVLYVVLARVLNGVSYALDNTGRQTYFMRHVPKKRIGSAYGYFETLTSFWWILAVLTSLVLVEHLETHHLFLFIIPTTLVALYLILKIKEDPRDHHEKDWYKKISIKAYWESLQEVKLWNKDLKHLACIHFISGIILSITAFFLPITLYQNDVALSQIIILMTIYSLPGLFGSPLGALSDKIGEKVLSISFFFLSFTLLFISLFESFAVLLVLIFLIGIFETTFVLATQSRIANLGTAGHYGSISGSFSALGSIAGIIGPILIGFTMDLYSLSTASVILGGIGVVASILYYKKHHRTT